MRNSSCILSCFVTSSLCFAQSLSVGVIGGAMATNDLSNQWVQDVSTRYALGPQLNIGLPLGFSVEAESLSYFLIDGPTPKDVLDRYTRLTGRPSIRRFSGHTDAEPAPLHPVLQIQR